MAEKTLSNFLDDIKEIISMRPTLSRLHKLQDKLRCVTNYSVQENTAQFLVKLIVKYIDFTIKVSLGKEFKVQTEISRTSFSILTYIISEKVQSIFIEVVTRKVLDVIIDGVKTSWCIKKGLLKVYNICILKFYKKLQQKTLKKLPDFYLSQMVESIGLYTDYDMQATIIKTIFLMYDKGMITSNLKDIIPEKKLSKIFAKINLDTFDDDIRTFLNVFNETTSMVFSILCKKVYLRNTKSKTHMADVNGSWVDFNLPQKIITWYGNKSSFYDNKVGGTTHGDAWNLITLLVSDVQNVTIKRLNISGDILIHFKLEDSCISSFDDNQDDITLARDLKLVLAFDSKTNKLLSEVLPQLFNRRFQCNLSKGPSSKSKQEIGTSLDVEIQKPGGFLSTSANPELRIIIEPLPEVDKMKKNTNNKSTRNDIHTLKCDGSLNVEKEPSREKSEKNIIIISDILIRPRFPVFREETEIKNVEYPTITPIEVIQNSVASENMILSDSEEISNEIVAENLNHDDMDSARRHILKYLRPTFQSLLTPQSFSQEYQDVVAVHNILKKYQ